MPKGGEKSLCMYLVPLAVSDKAIGIVVKLNGSASKKITIVQ